MRSEQLYLQDIVGACNAIGRFIEGRTREEFLADEFFQSALMAQFGIIGVAISHVPDEFRARYPDIPWYEARGLRNVVVHTYFAIDWDILWFAARDDIPVLREAIADILKQEFTSRDSDDTPRNR